MARRPVKTCLCIWFALAISPAIAQVPFAPADQRDDRIYLRAATIDTSIDAGLSLADAGQFDAQRYYILKLDGAMTPERQSALKRAGVTMGDYLPAHAFLVSGADLRKGGAAGLSFVQWVGQYDDALKLDPEIGARLEPYQTPERIALEEQGLLKVAVTLFAGADLDAAMKGFESLGGSVLAGHLVGGQGLVDLVISPDRLGDLAARFDVQYIEDGPEITLRNGTNRWIVQSNIANVTPLYDNGLHGEGQILGILDSRVDRNHCSFSDANPIGPTHRKIVAYNATAGAASHGTHCAGTAVGDAGSNTDTRGIAYLGKLAFGLTPSFTESATNTALTTHHNQGARLHTNSWGDDGTTAYNALCRAFDVFMYDNEESLATLAVTNTSTLRNPENAKNLLAVGASQDTPSQGNHCSGGTGPTSDGRRKPEVYAPGCSTNSAASSTACSTTALTGTSMACPAVAGTGMLIRQYFVDGYYPTGVPIPEDAFIPSGALVKAMLINSAVDMTGIGGYPSNSEGWGRVLADNAVYFPGDARKLIVEDVRNADGLHTGANAEYAFEVLGGGQQVRVTLVWTEPAAAAGAGIAQVNNLDLEVVAANGDTYLGNVFGAGASVTGGSADIRNNVEQVHVNSPPSGSWTVRVKGTAVQQGTQGFALVITGDVVAEQPPFSISVPDGAPTTLLPGEVTLFPVRIVPGAEAILPGSQTLYYRYIGGAYIAVPLAPAGNDLYTAALPPASCAATPEFYVEASGTEGTVRTSPPTGASAPYTAAVGILQTLFTDNFQLDLGWGVQNTPGLTGGAWARGVPVGGGDRGDPPSDYDGSGQCYLTDPADGDTDVDGGTTWLISPPIDLADGDADISYAIWYTNNFGADPNNDVFRTYVSNNDGGTWATVETIGPVTSAGWMLRGFRVSDFVTPTSQVRVRFEASDLGSGSVVEAGVDAFLVTRFECTGGLPGDMNCDGLVTPGDIAPFVLLLTNPQDYAAQYPGCDPLNGDFNGDGIITPGDIAGFVAALTGA